MRFLSSLVVLFATTAMVTACSGNSKSTGGTGGSGTGGTGGSGTGGSGGAQCANATGTATVTGTMLGTTLVPKDAAVVKVGGDTFLVITDFAGICALANANKANSNSLVFDFYGNTIAPGTVQVGKKLDVQYANYDKTCGSPKGESATTGSVTFTSVNACGASGTFVANMNNDHVSGSFNAVRCADQPGDAGPATCK